MRSSTFTFKILSKLLFLHGGVVRYRPPLHQVCPVLGSDLLGDVPPRHPDVDDPPLISGMYQFILAPPLPVRRVLLRSLPVHPAHQAGQRNPEQERNEDDCANYVVLEKFEDSSDADVINEIPDSDNVLVGFLTLTFVAESLEAWSAIRQDVNGCFGDAGCVEISPAASLARILLIVTHAGLLTLSLAERNTFPISAFSLFHTARVIFHMLGFRTRGQCSCTDSVLLAGGEVRIPALGIHSHELAVDTTRGVLVTANLALPESAVFIATSIFIL